MVCAKNKFVRIVFIEFMRLRFRRRFIAAGKAIDDAMHRQC